MVERHAGLGWRIMDEFIGVVLQLTPTYRLIIMELRANTFFAVWTQGGHLEYLQRGWLIKTGRERESERDRNRDREKERQRESPRYPYCQYTLIMFMMIIMMIMMLIQSFVNVSLPIFMTAYPYFWQLRFNATDIWSQILRDNFHFDCVMFH